ncbi:hypothetical protein [Synechococcus sp. RS9902]|uniref:hypothetical protein n=1 Tax=Synechococcus sp. RS9902 TaxID=221345 RepID=UPI0016443075|nr:hypothetical protein [Synechococcus sp. RS9902]QNI96565.1 hypothetical protein SynRS9902_00663 [Synechococcus sp. RS9902]
MDNCDAAISCNYTDNGALWIKKCTTATKELQLLNAYFKNHHNKNRTNKSGENMHKILQGNAEWTKHATLFIEAEARAKQKNTYLAAKLIAIGSEDKYCLLTTAIILGKAGYKDLAVSAIIRTLNLKNLHSRDILGVTLAGLEPLVSKLDSEQIETIHLRDQKRLLQELALNKQVAKIFNIALLNHNDVTNCGDLTNEIKQLAKYLRHTNASTESATHQEILTYAMERRKRRKKEAKNRDKPLIRTIHHLACTGGTLISKCIASMPEVALVSEINPFNRSGNEFEPTNPLLLFERSTMDPSEEDIKRNFKSQIQQIIEICKRKDLDLILRDHSHTDFCTGRKISETCPVNDYLQDDYELVSVVSVRHPLDSYLGIVNAGWNNQFRPNTLNEYSKRYLSFIQKYNSLNIIKYETFCNDPSETMKELCNILKINFLDGFQERFGQQRLSGDSGRKDVTKIEARPRRPIPREISSQISRSDHYFELLKKLGYDH